MKRFQRTALRKMGHALHMDRNMLTFPPAPTLQELENAFPGRLEALLSQFHLLQIHTRNKPPCPSQTACAQPGIWEQSWQIVFALSHLLQNTHTLCISGQMNIQQEGRKKNQSQRIITNASVLFREHDRNLLLGYSNLKEQAFK